MSAAVPSKRPQRRRRKDPNEKRKLYVGRAGQMAVMAEFLLRGWNVALPEVDMGDDVFVVHDRENDFSRIQVKTAVGKAQAGGYSAQFKVGRQQLDDTRLPEVRYIFLTRWQGRWDVFVIVPQTELRVEQDVHHAGSEVENSIVFRLVFVDGKVKAAGDRDWSGFLNKWSHWERIQGRSLDATINGEAP